MIGKISSLKCCSNIRTGCPWRWWKFTANDSGNGREKKGFLKLKQKSMQEKRIRLT